ncbi:MAG: hypothetical protein RMJ56_14255 [Gemmataceae bacterium]|nr:hypothetical protein [Gemmata sp.]MDW8198756.1 hypothetical protein [Gemmataceae bacterium]
MVARITPTSSTSVASDAVPALTDAIRAEVAQRRAEGQSWAAIAAALQWDVADLRHAVRHDPDYEAAFLAARREWEYDAEADLIHTLRQHLHNPDTALAAATLLAKYFSDRRRDETRLEVERRRCQARSATPARPTRSASHPSDQSDHPLTADEERQAADEERQAEQVFWRRQQLVAQDAAKPGAEVYLWGGDHPIGDTPPTAADTRLVIVSDMTLPGRHIYWAMRYPPPTDLRTGPFPAQPARPMPSAQPCPPEIAAHCEIAAHWQAGTQNPSSSTSAPP